MILEKPFLGMKKIKIGGCKIIVYILCLFLVGCHTHRQDQNPLIIASYTLKPVKVNIVNSTHEIGIVYGRPKDNVFAFYDPESNTAWVPKNKFPDENGQIMPNLFLLGHELWHSVNLHYHSNTNSMYSYPTLPGYSIHILKDLE